jgi:hypothetical protein
MVILHLRWDVLEDVQEEGVSDRDELLRKELHRNLFLRKSAVRG